MRPILFSLFGLPFASWYVFFALAGVSAYLYANAQLVFAARTTGTDSAHRAVASFGGLFAVCYVAGWFGARAFSVWNEELDVRGFFATVSAVFSLGAMTFYGGALAAAAAGLVYSVWKKLPLGLLFDAVLPAGVLSLGLGRIGCHLNGDDFGQPLADALQSDAPWWAVRFPNIQDGGLFRYPVQLEEAGFSIALALLAFFAFRSRLFWRARGAPRSGALAAAVALVSAGHRFANEFFRGDPRGSFLSTSLSISQGIAVLLFFVSAFLLVWRLRAPRAPQGAHS